MMVRTVDESRSGDFVNNEGDHMFTIVMKEIDGFNKNHCHDINKNNPITDTIDREA